MTRGFIIGIMAVMIFSVGLLSGCAVREKLEGADDRAGEMFFNGPQTASSTLEVDKKTATSTWADFKELTQGQKEKIDKWFEENNLNRYGDAIGTIYAGGTPLFNEMTGEAKERFQYILEKIPDILEKIE